MAVAASSRPRIVVDGKFFRLGEKKFYVKGVTYGPFAPDATGVCFAPPEETSLDFRQIVELGANLMRVYQVPPHWFLDLAEQHALKVLVDAPWNKHLCFDSETRRKEARDAVRSAVSACARHPAVFAFSVANEIPPDIVRWAGARAVAAFVEELVSEAKRIDPDCLCTFTNFPSTEFLRPQNLDFVSFNVFLHNRRPFSEYLSRLQMVADTKPLVLSEFGVDSVRAGESAKSEMLAWQIEEAYRGGLAGAIVFAYTDDWYKDGRQVEDWGMGLVTRERRAKKSFDAVRSGFQAAPGFPLPRAPRVSVVVASYNGERTLKGCLDSLLRLDYPDFEILLVDDGSTDATPGIAEQYPTVRWIRHGQNLGLSAARNSGIAAATGEVIAFTDADCRADEDWLRYLVGDLVHGPYAGMGGPNLLPADDSHVAAAVMVSPGGPAHVMLTDRQAEHIPGCNMAFYRQVLREIGGFDPMFRSAGDDVDVCWRLQEAGYKIGFSPSAVVWHHRRSTLGAYLKQQYGYGRAEALLLQKHPENFNLFGNGIWRGRIYSPSKFGVEIQPPVIYHGRFGSAGYQKLYTSGPATPLMLCTTLEYYLFIVLPLGVLSVTFHRLLPLAVASLLLPLAVCALAGAQATLPAGRAAWWSRPLVALLFLLQPIVRGWARLRRRLALPRGVPRLASRESLDSLALRLSPQPLNEVDYWTHQRIERLNFVDRLLQRLDQQGWARNPDIGWSDYDVEIYGSRWSRVQLITMAEDHPENRQLLRCRLRANWSPAAALGFWSILGLELLLIGLFAAWRPWSWLLLLTQPVLLWLFWFDRRRLQSVVAVFLDELAKELDMSKVKGRPERPNQLEQQPPAKMENNPA
jgi:GT2 family glycosyltransferase